MTVLIRTLWGDPSHGSKFRSVWRRYISKGPDAYNGNPEFQHIYVYGKNSARRLERLGYKNVVKLSNKPFPDRRMPWWDPVRKQEIYPWHYKLEFLLAAMSDHDCPVIYCDWDVRLVGDWEHGLSLLDDREFYAPLMKFKLPKHLERGTFLDRHVSTSGGWMYFRSADRVRRILDSMREHDHKDFWWCDELAIDNLLETDNKGWIGTRAWLERFEPPIVVSNDLYSPWGPARNDGRFVTRDTLVPFVWERVFEM